MRKPFTMIIILSLLLTGCNTIQANELDTSNLEKDYSKRDAVKYDAESLETALAAVPFRVPLPESLPFESQPLRPKMIEERDGELEHIMIELIAASTTEKEAVLRMYVGNGDYLVSDDELAGTPLTLSNGIKAHYLYVQPYHILKFKHNGLEFSLNYYHHQFAPKTQKQQLINIANNLNK